MRRMNFGRRALLSALLILCFFLSLCACGGDASLGNTGWDASTPKSRCAAVEGLSYEKTLPLTAATQFVVDCFSEGESLVSVSDGRQYLLLPYGLDALDGSVTVADSVTVLPLPVSSVYVAGSASMDFFVACHALPMVRFSALQESDWNIPEAAAAMKAGDIAYAGKYSAPDYELLTSGRCGLAVENTMVYHSPSVIEKMEALGIPVFVDASSREKTPEGRMEWVKVYGLMTGHYDEADAAFEEQLAEFSALGLESTEPGKKTRPTVAFFSLRSNGTVTVRRSTDYIPDMIQKAGGAYVFSDLGAGEETNRSTETISMEEFYTTAKNADYFILNSTIEGEVHSLLALLKDAPALADCKAVKAGQVYCTTRDFYQHTMGQGTFVKDLRLMLTGTDDSEMTYLLKLKQ